MQVKDRVCPLGTMDSMQRAIIEIDEALCDGCGDCVTSCAEGAIQVIDGKAKLVRDDFCDGFGDCVGHCPTGALKVVQKDVAAFDEKAVKLHLLKTEGPQAVQKMEEAQNRHHQNKSGHLHSLPGGCPGSAMRMPTEKPQAAPTQMNSSSGPAQAIPSELRQWPVQLHLVQPQAPFFQNRELAVMATCGPIASADVHWRFLRGRSVVVACPKLDDTSPYVEKLAAILAEPSIPKVVTVIMEVPCCRGLAQMVREAAQRTGRKDLAVEETIVSLDGQIQ